MFKKNKKNVQSQAFARQLVTFFSPKSVIAEQFKTMRTNLNFSMPMDNLKSLLITSSEMSEGKSTISSNIAVAFAQEGRKVIIIDADMRKPTTHHTFKVSNTQGLSNLLVRQVTIEQVIQKTDIDGLEIITSGTIPPNPSELLASEELTILLEKLKGMYDVVIFDAPPVLPVTDAQIISNLVDGTVLVVNYGETSKEAVVKAKELLEKSKANILGAVLNNYKLDNKNDYYHYYGE